MYPNLSNPFKALFNKLNSIEAMLKERNSVSPAPPTEIIDGNEVCKRLRISGPTLIAWRRRDVVPFIIVDGVIRYNWPKVIEALESRKKAKIKKPVGAG